MSAPGFEPRKHALLATLLVLTASLVVALGAGWLSTTAGDTKWEALQAAGSAFIGGATVLGICVTLYYLIKSNNR